MRFCGLASQSIDYLTSVTLDEGFDYYEYEPLINFQTKTHVRKLRGISQSFEIIKPVFQIYPRPSVCKKFYSLVTSIVIKPYVGSTTLHHPSFFWLLGDLDFGLSFSYSREKPFLRSTSTLENQRLSFFVSEI